MWAMKSLLSARAAENKIIVFSSASLAAPKTNFLEKLLAPFHESSLLLMTEKAIDFNLIKASQNLPKLTVATAFVIHNNTITGRP